MKEPVSRLEGKKITFGSEYKPRVHHNQKAWEAVQSTLQKPGVHTYDELRAVAINASHKVGHRFIDYAVSSGWLIAKD